MEYVAGLVKVPASELAKYDLAGAKRHRKQIREALGFRPSTVADEKALAEWLAVEVCPVELVEDRQREALLVQCRARKIEPPGRTRVEKVFVAARGKWEKTFCARTIGRRGEARTARLLSLVAEDNEAGTALLAALKRDPGAVGLDSLLTEITKLNDVRRLGLPYGLFADCSEKLAAAWRARAIKMYPSDFRDTSEDVRITLLAALCSSRQALVDLLVALVHKINARAERRTEKQLTAELKKVRGKEGILFKLATAVVDKPDEVVRRALFPVVGEKTLRELVAGAKANEKVFKTEVRTTLRSSYSSYYRQMLPPLLNTLGFKCNNTAYRPVMDAMKLLQKYADVDGKTRV
ncbi:DUF4158 domain-containing protein [Streptomyces sp. NBC_01643]|uniref:DUF4158 domain-containing protein n=1 Tax=Streptomyces sp. NBC_01643 TaxID=2975906 RepID=UPI002F91455C|nr:DUF4158 domain-containing protein [Streptomyces sp. NBC_01643]